MWVALRPLATLKATMRLFIAIPLDDPLKHKLLSLQQRIEVGGARVRWLRADQLHLTLKFIGEVENGKIPPIGEVMERVARHSAAFELELSGTGCFPPKGPVRIIWVGGSEPSGTLRAAVHDLEQGLAGLGIPAEARPFTEHFTIGRVKSDPTRGKLRETLQATPFQPDRQRVGEFVLYQSVLAPCGARYTPVSRAALME